MRGQRKSETLINREARELLQRKGYRVRAEKYRSKEGEIDLVMEKRGEVVFVEVVVVLNERDREPWEFVRAWKVKQVKRAGEEWCCEYEYKGKRRVDVVGVYLEGLTKKVTRVEHWEAVDG